MPSFSTYLRAIRDKNIKKNMQLIEQCEIDGCQRCGIKDPRILEFHHRDRSTKLASPNLLARQGSKFTRLLKELAKCDVLCANCHRIVESEIADGARSFPWQTSPRAIWEGTNGWIEEQTKFVPFRLALTDERFRKCLYDRFLRSVDKRNGCWFWRHQGPFIVNGEHFNPKIAAFAFKNGTFPSGHLVTDCEQGCVNPEHIRPKKLEVHRWIAINETPQTRKDAISQLLANDEELSQHKERFLKHTSITNGHWIWKGGRIKGTPEFWLFGKAISAKKFALALKYRKFSRGKIKSCCEFANDCVNPDHLRCGHLENGAAA